MDGNGTVEMKSMHKIDDARINVEDSKTSPSVPKDVEATGNNKPTPGVEIVVGAPDGEKEAEIDQDLVTDDGITYDESDWQENPKATDDEFTKQDTFIGKMVQTLQRSLSYLLASVTRYTKGYLSTAVFLLGYVAYFIAAMVHERLEGEASGRLLGFTLVFIVVKTRTYWIPGLKTLVRSVVNDPSEPRVMSLRRAIRWCLYLAMLALMAWVLVDQGRKDIRNLRSVPGLMAMMLLCLVCSAAPSHVNWHTIYWSVGLQFICALFVLRIDFGIQAMQWIQDRFDEFFANTRTASFFMFGPNYMDHYLVFGALPVILFSNATLGLLYYFGAIQLVINCIGSFLQFVMGTTPLESTAVAGGIFLEGSMAILGLRPYLGRMTKSQLFLILTSCFSSLGGAYIGMLQALKVSVADIIPAMLMSAPATFTVCKLIWPEAAKVKKIKLDSENNEVKQNNGSTLEVVQNSSTAIVSIIANVIATIFVFYSFIGWVNHTFTWIGDRVGVDNLTMELMFSYLLYPVALMMGVETDDCKRVATLLGYRLVSSNLVGFQEMQKMVANRYIFEGYMNATHNMGPYETDRDDIIIGNQTLKLGFISERSQRVATYSMCGFSSIISVAINISIITTLIPRRKAWLSKIFLIALVAGNISNCMTGSFAAMFFYD